MPPLKPSGADFFFLAEHAKKAAFGQLFLSHGFAKLDSSDGFFRSPLGCFFFILSDALAHDFAIDVDFHPDGLVVSRAFVLGDDIGDIHISVLLHHFLQVRLVVMVIVSLIDQIEKFLHVTQDEAGCHFIVVIEIDRTDDRFEGIASDLSLIHI